MSTAADLDVLESGNRSIRLDARATEDDQLLVLSFDHIQPRPQSFNPHLVSKISPINPRKKLLYLSDRGIHGRMLGEYIGSLRRYPELRMVSHSSLERAPNSLKLQILARVLFFNARDPSAPN